MSKNEISDLHTEYLPGLIKGIDDVYKNHGITTAEYIQIGLQLKILESLNHIEHAMRIRN